MSKSRGFLIFLGLALFAVIAFSQSRGGKGWIENSPVGRQDGFIEVTGKLDGGSLSLTGGAASVTRLGKLTATISPAQVAANTCAEQTFTVTGVATGDVVDVNKPSAQAGLSVPNVRASAANQVGINFCNNTASPITPTASETYLFFVRQ
jgi:hypothetical protein